MIIQKISDKTVAAKFKRLTFFHGQLLTEQDLLEEQTYIREKLKLHNRYHGNGVVKGLAVNPAKKAGHSNWDDIANRPIVTIDPGLALDCEGNEVVVCKPYDIDLTEYLEYLYRIGAISSNNTSASIIIGIAYGECCSNPSTQYITSCSNGSQEQYSRIREGFRAVIGLDYEDEQGTEVKRNLSSTYTSECRGAVPDCSNEMIISLAIISIDSNSNVNKPVTITQITDLRRYAWTVESLDNWENARSELLKKIVGVEYDISTIINRRVADVRSSLSKMKINVKEQSLTPAMLTEKDVESVRNASPIIPEGSTVTLVTDEKGEKVLFGLLNLEAGEIKSKSSKR